MKAIKTKIEGLIILEPTVHGDNRGYFMEAFSDKVFRSLVGDVDFVQENESKSKYGVVRGLHFQEEPFAQAKLVRAVSGVIWDIAVDIRKGSPTFGKYVAIELSEDNKKQLFIPRGFAHGFSVLSEEAIFQYKCDNYYNPESEDAILWNDAELDIDWRIPEQDVIVSDKDKKNNPFSSLLMK